MQISPAWEGKGAIAAKGNNVRNRIRVKCEGCGGMITEKALERHKAKCGQPKPPKKSPGTPHWKCSVCGEPIPYGFRACWKDSGRGKALRELDAALEAELPEKWHGPEREYF